MQKISLVAILGLFFSALGAQDWGTLHTETRDVLISIWQEQAALAAEKAPQGILEVSPPLPQPWLVLVGFTGGLEKEDSRTSGMVEIHRHLDNRIRGQDGIATFIYNHAKWRNAAADIVDAVRNGPAADQLLSPLIVAYGHSLGGGSILRLARELERHDLEISLAVFIDHFGWRNPRLPANIRSAVIFYQRSGILSGLPLRGKRKLIPRDPKRTVVLGSYKIEPETEHWGWSWNFLQPLFYRHHHRITHDIRLRGFFAGILALEEELTRPQHRPTTLRGRRSIFVPSCPV